MMSVLNQDISKNGNTVYKISTEYYKPIEPIKKTEINNDTIKVHAYT